jgi:hypothetical protein
VHIEVFDEVTVTVSPIASVVAGALNVFTLNVLLVIALNVIVCVGSRVEYLTTTTPEPPAPLAGITPAEFPPPPLPVFAAPGKPRAPPVAIPVTWVPAGLKQFAALPVVAEPEV